MFVHVWLHSASWKKAVEKPNQYYKYVPDSSNAVFILLQ